MNKTDFRIDVNGVKIVITIKSHKRFLLTDANNRDYIISIECISADTNECALSTFIIIVKVEYCKSDIFKRAYRRHCHHRSRIRIF